MNYSRVVFPPGSRIHLTGTLHVWAVSEGSDEVTVDWSRCVITADPGVAPLIQFHPLTPDDDRV